MRGLYKKLAGSVVTHSGPSASTEVAYNTEEQFRKDMVLLNSCQDSSVRVFLAAEIYADYKSSPERYARVKDQLVPWIKSQKLDERIKRVHAAPEEDYIKELKSCLLHTYQNQRQFILKTIKLFIQRTGRTTDFDRNLTFVDRRLMNTL